MTTRNWRYGTLHSTRSVEIARELLLHGASVNGKNVCGQTPLTYAIKHDKGLEFVRELLKHGAHVNATDGKGNTPLNLAVKKDKFLSNIIKELLEHGADMNIRSRQVHALGSFNSSLDNAVHNPQCAKLLIKMTLLQNFDKNYRDIINLTPYKSMPVFRELSNFLGDCILEVTQMKADKVNESLSLYEFMITKKLNTEALFSTNEERKKINDEVLVIRNSTNYHVYHDLITDKIRLGLRDVTREILLNSLDGLKIYTESDVSIKDVKGKRVVLDCYSAHGVYKYLSKDELLCLVIAFYNQSSVSVESHVQLQQQQKRHKII